MLCDNRFYKGHSRCLTDQKFAETILLRTSSGKHLRCSTHRMGTSKCLLNTNLLCRAPPGCKNGRGYPTGNGRDKTEQMCGPGRASPSCLENISRYTGWINMQYFANLQDLSYANVARNVGGCNRCPQDRCVQTGKYLPAREPLVHP